MSFLLAEFYRQWIERRWVWAIDIGNREGLQITMFNWIKGKVDAKLTAVQAAEVDDWTRKLKSIDSIAVGGIVAMSAHARNQWRAKTGVDLLMPHLAIHQEPFIAMQLLQNLKGLQKAGNETAASGFFPWLFTVRACFDLNLLPNTRELWRQLERGFEDVESASEDLEIIFGARLSLERAKEFPQGFIPDPL